MTSSIRNSTRLAVPADRAFALFRAEAEEHDLPTRTGPDSLTVVTQIGEISVQADRGRTRLVLDACDRVALQALQEIVEYHLDGAGIGADLRWSLAEAGAHPANMTFATIVSSERISPSYRRVRLSGPEIARFSRDGLHFRLLFAPAGQEGEWPTVGEDGRTLWPGGMSAWHRPVYTVRAVDAEAGGLDFDVFMHDGGRTTEWCRSVEPGSPIALIGPGGGWYPQAGWIGLFGDETGLPAIARILAALPAGTRGTAAIAIAEPGDVQELEKPAGIDLNWLRRGGASSLTDLLRAAEPPSTDRFLWFAAEKDEVDQAREWARSKGLARSETYVAAYWTR